MNVNWAASLNIEKVVTLAPGPLTGTPVLEGFHSDFFSFSSVSN